MMAADLTEQIIGAAIKVHKHWGPGLYEEVYVPVLKQGIKRMVL
jgi:hypothetical protein